MFDCKFCSYSRLLKQKNEGWEYSKEDIIRILESSENKDITEVHIVGGVHPKMGLHYFVDLIKRKGRCSNQHHRFMYKIRKGNIKGDEIKFGARVEIQDDDNGEISSYQIVGDYESDINNKKHPNKWLCFISI